MRNRVINIITAVLLLLFTLPFLTLVRWNLTNVSALPVSDEARYPAPILFADLSAGGLALFPLIILLLILIKHKRPLGAFFHTAAGLCALGLISAFLLIWKPEFFSDGAVILGADRAAHPGLPAAAFYGGLFLMWGSAVFTLFLLHFGKSSKKGA